MEHEVARQVLENGTDSRVEPICDEIALCGIQAIQRETLLIYGAFGHELIGHGIRQVPRRHLHSVPLRGEQRLVIDQHRVEAISGAYIGGVDLFWQVHLTRSPSVRALFPDEIRWPFVEESRRPFPHILSATDDPKQ